MARSEFRWEAPPRVIAENLDRYDVAARVALGKVGQLYAPQMEAYAKANAPWNDRTTNARQTIMGRSSQTPTMVEITLAGTTDYFPFLELGTSKMRPYPIIMPTIDAYQARIMDAVRRIVED